MNTCKLIFTYSVHDVTDVDLKQKKSHKEACHLTAKNQFQNKIFYMMSLKPVSFNAKETFS